MHKPAPRELAVIAAPIFLAEAAVVAALFLGAVIVVQGRTLWAVVLGWVQ